jgi:hypothetical protein
MAEFRGHYVLMTLSGHLQQSACNHFNLVIQIYFQKQKNTFIQSFFYPRTARCIEACIFTKFVQLYQTAIKQCPKNGYHMLDCIASKLSTNIL